MTTMTPDNKKSLLVELGEGELWRGPADIRLDGDELFVTLDLPRHEPSDLEWEVTPHALIVRCKRKSRSLHLTIPLRTAVRADRYTVCATRSVFDIQMERA